MLNMLFVTIKILHLLLLMVIVMGSCMREQMRHPLTIHPQEMPTLLAVNTAKEWVEENQTAESFDILWEESIVQRSDTAYYVEAPVLGIKPEYLSPQEVLKYPVRLVVKVKGKNKDARIMCISRFRDNAQDLNAMTYSQIGEFTGSLTYFKIDEKPTYSLIFNKGEVTKMFLYRNLNKTKSSSTIRQTLNSGFILGKECFSDDEKDAFVQASGVDNFGLDDMRSELGGGNCWVMDENLDEVIIRPRPTGGSEDKDKIDNNEGFDPIGETDPIDGGGGRGNDPSLPVDTAKRPCSDFEKGKANPLTDMKLAPPNTWNLKGCLFGMTRDGGTKLHNGIDFGAEVGTPIYATSAGVVSRVVSSQPNRVGITKYYPSGYDGDKDGAGNRIYIDIGGGVLIGYWHLQAGNPIAINPRTGAMYKAGDAVMMGDMVGYVGLTGNANIYNIPHLHITAKKDGKNVNPAPYLNINEDLDSQKPINTTKITTPCEE